MIKKCAACGSKRLARGHLATDGRSGSVSFYAPGASVRSRRHITNVSCAVCADCGNVHVVATDLAAVNEVCEEQHKRSLQLAE